MASITIYNCIVKIEFFSDMPRECISSTELEKNWVDIEVEDGKASILGIEGLGLLSWKYEDMILADELSVQVMIKKSGIQETADLLDRLLSQ